MLVVGKLDAIHLRSINRPDSYGILTIKLLQHWRRSADHTNGNCIVRIRAHSLLTQQPLPAYQRTESISTLWDPLIATLEWAQVSQLLPQLNLSRLTVKPIRRRGRRRVRDSNPRYIAVRLISSQLD